MARLTYEALLVLQEECVHEIIDGKAVPMVEYSRHDRIRDRMERIAARSGISVGDVSIESEVPDITLLLQGGAKGALVIEVVEHATRRADEIDKRDLYERKGVPEYWVVDPHSQSLKVYRQESSGVFAHALLITARDDKTLTTPLFPGFSIDLTEVFEE